MALQDFIGIDSTAADPVRAGDTAAQIPAAAQAGDQEAKAALNLHADRLARGLASVINILDPEVIVLGGGLSNLTHLYETLPPLIKRRLFCDGMATRLAAPLHGDSSGVRGAAWLWGTQ